VEPSKVGLMISLMNSVLAFDYGQRARDFCDNNQPMLCNRTELKRVCSFAFSAIYSGNTNFEQLLINAYLFPWNVCLVIIIIIIKCLWKIKKKRENISGVDWSEPQTHIIFVVVIIS